MRYKNITNSIMNQPSKSPILFSHYFSNPFWSVLISVCNEHLDIIFINLHSINWPSAKVYFFKFFTVSEHFFKLKTSSNFPI